MLRGVIRIDNFNGKTVGVYTGTIHEKIAAERFPDSPIKYYNSSSELAQATESGKKPDVRLDISFSEQDRAFKILIKSAGEPYNPFEDIVNDSLYDNLGLMIIDRKAKQRGYVYKDGFNEISLSI